MAKPMGPIGTVLSVLVLIVFGVWLISNFYEKTKKMREGQFIIEAKKEVDLTKKALRKTKTKKQHEYLKHYQTRLLYEIMNFNEFKDRDRLQAAIDESRNARARVDKLPKIPAPSKTMPVKRTPKRTTDRNGGGKILDEILGPDQGVEEKR